MLATFRPAAPLAALLLVLSELAPATSTTRPLSAIAGPHPTAQAACAGKPVTIVGTALPDVIPGTPGPDVINGLGGNDAVNGVGGNDIICGGAGDDVIHGNDGNDAVDGDDVAGLEQPGDDLLFGDAGDDDVRYGQWGGDSHDCGAGLFDLAVGGPPAAGDTEVACESWTP